MLPSTSSCVLFLVLTCVAISARKTLVVPHTAGRDDTPALMGVLAHFSSDSTILFKKGITYNIFTPIKFPILHNVEIWIEGNLMYPTNIPAIQAIVASSNFSGSWFTFTGGSNVTLRGSRDPAWGWIDGHGQAWWDAQNQINRPRGIAFNMISGGVIRDMKIWKPIAWNFATSGSSNLLVTNNQIHAVSTDPQRAFPFNTDGFSAGGTNLLFEDNHVVNGDDCLTVGSGAKNIRFRNSYCEGGHGLSIGSLGKGGAHADVGNVVIENVVMKNTLYGARFKSWTGGKGVARNVTYRNITFTNVRFPIYITQNYWDQGLGPAPNTTSTNNTRVEDFLFQGFKGSINDSANFFERSCVTNPCWYYVPGATGREVVIFDLHANTTSNIVVKDISAVNEDSAPVAVMCDLTTISNDVGFKCQDGAFIPTKVGM